VHGKAAVVDDANTDVTAEIEIPSATTLEMAVTDSDEMLVESATAGGVAVAEAPVAAAVLEAQWLPDAEKELKKIPFFVRGKAKRNTERYAIEHGLAQISVDTLYEAKAHYGR
jgi:light-independent protochlorophyllide reductase subunit B